MSAPSNLGFETASFMVPGYPANWNILLVSTACAVALFPILPHDEFSWDSSYLEEFELANLDACAFGTRAITPKYVDNFEELWHTNHDYLWELSQTAQGLTEAFDWSTFEATLGSTATAYFLNGGYDYAMEMFEEELADLNTAEAAQFATMELVTGELVRGAVERFDYHRPPRVFTTFPVSDSVVFTVPHNILVGTSERVFLEEVGKLPEPLRARRLYYAAASDAFNLTLSIFPGGAPIEIADVAQGGVGWGENTLQGDPSTHWVQGLEG